MSTIRRSGRYSIVPEALIRSDLSDRAVRLWQLLDRYAGSNEVAFPSQETLARDLRCSVPSIERATAELRKAEWLISRRRPGRARGNEYVLTEPGAAVDEPSQPTGEAVSPITDESSPITSEGSSPVTSDGQKEASPGRDASLKETATSSLRSDAVADTDALIPEPPQPEKPKTLSQRAYALAGMVKQLRPILNVHAVAGVCKMALVVHDDEAVERALRLLVEEGRSVSAETLRIALEGPPRSNVHRGPWQGGKLTQATTDACRAGRMRVNL